MKGKQRLYIALSVMVTILFVTTIFFYAQYKSYRVENRKLVLENDSIMSVNLHLKDTLRKASRVSSLMK